MFVACKRVSFCCIYFDLLMWGSIDCDAIAFVWRCFLNVCVTCSVLFWCYWGCGCCCCVVVFLLACLLLCVLCVCCVWLFLVLALWFEVLVCGSIACVVLAFVRLWLLNV